MSGFDHINRAWFTPDPFALGKHRDLCGCTLLPCGHVSAREANERDCPQHAFRAARTIRSSHDAASCPALEGGGE